MTAKFISDDFEEAIKFNVINKMYPNLMFSHQKLLTTYLYGLIQMSATCHDFYSDHGGFIEKLKQNSFKDVKWLLTFLLPYINQNIVNVSELKDLSELYTLRYDKISADTKEKLKELKIEDINLVSPKYAFTNLQYGRCIRGDSNVSIKFNEAHLSDNYYILLNTIMHTRCKMYINWIDILPYRIDNFKESRLYKSTMKAFDKKLLSFIDLKDEYPIEKIRNDERIRSLNNNISGLNMEDIYNTISLDMYESIVTYKWLIYDVIINIDGENVSRPLIYALNSLLYLDNIFLEEEYKSIADNLFNNFVTTWQQLISMFEKGVDIALNEINDTLNENVIIYKKTIEIMVKSMILFFDRKYSKISALDKNNKYIKLARKKIKNIDDYDEERMRDVTYEKVLRTIKSIDPSDAYNFLLESIQGFNRTWYAKRMIGTTQIDNNTKHYEFNVFPFPQTINNVTFKNVYNFCKSLVHIEKNTNPNVNEKRDVLFSDTYMRLPRMWSELDDITKKIICDRLNENNNNKWFNIRGNMIYVLRQQLGSRIDSRNIENKISIDMQNIYTTVRKELPNIMFEILIKKGILSYMIAENDLTNNLNYDVSNNDDKKKLVNELKNRRFSENNPYGNNSYYYLTELPYNQTGTNYIKVEDKADDYDYFRICSTVKTAWYLATTYHWVAQTGFCHKFLNNRVTFITGGTGAGKTTQVPKLYMYYFKAIEKVADPTIIVTIPRTVIAKKNSEFVSQELAVPIKLINRDTGDDYSIKTKRYVQYKHMKDDNSDDGFYPKIRFITDGSVLDEAKDPFMKKKVLIGDQFVYSRNNKYNVVLVDEAHEHNTNMDMILTLMRNTVYYNNKLRLVIMSATIDGDEPIYRRFYRDINDNRKYPLDNWIKKHNIDRINTDRRFHISPPGELPTRYKIEEHYCPDDRNCTDADPIKVTIDIINNTNTGDILLFQPGVKEIMNTIEKLNAPKVLPDDVIALPYHAQLAEQCPDCRDFMDTIDKNLQFLHIEKTDDFTSKSKKTLSIGNKNYKRCIIVATNIAEASISISSLEYVIDTGLEKTNVYDFERRSSILKTNYINEASQIQRRGRVGRLKPGTVYYMYKESTLRNNTKQFSISNQDIHQSVMLKFLRDPLDVTIFTDVINIIVSGLNIEKLQRIFENYNKNELQVTKEKQILYKFKKDSSGRYLLTKENILNLIDVSYKNHFMKYKNKITKPMIDFIDSIKNIISDHYMIFNGKLNEIIYYDYYGNDNYYDYKNAKQQTKIYFSGFDSEQLTDSTGEFYIIHPDELVIKRNINGEIIDADQYQVISKKRNYNDYKQYMKSNKILIFWETLINNGFVGITTLPNQDKLLGKTHFGEILRFCLDEMTEFKDDTITKILFYGYGLSKDDNEFERILSLVAMIDILKNEPITKLMSPNEIEYYKHSKNSFSDSPIIKSDIQMMNNIISFIQTLFTQNKKEYNVFNSDTIKSKTFRGENIENIQKGVPTLLNEKNTIPSKKDISDRNTLIKNITDTHVNELIRFLKSKKISSIIINKYISVETVISFIQTREKIRRYWNDIVYDNNIRNRDELKSVNVTDLRIILKNHRFYMEELGVDIFKAALLLSKPYNIKRKIIDTSSSYVSVYNPHYDTIVNLSPTHTYVDPPYYQEYILNISERPEFNIISNIVQVNVNDLMLLANIYNQCELSRNLTQRIISSDEKQKHFDKYIQTQYPPMNMETMLLPPTQPDFRNRTVPEHIFAISNFNKTIDIMRIELDALRSSRIFSLIERFGSNILTNYVHTCSDYYKILQNNL